MLCFSQLSPNLPWGHSQTGASFDAIASNHLMGHRKNENLSKASQVDITGRKALPSKGATQVRSKDRAARTCRLVESRTSKRSPIKVVSLGSSVHPKSDARPSPISAASTSRDRAMSSQAHIHDEMPYPADAEKIRAARFSAEKQAQLDALQSQLQTATQQWRTAKVNSVALKWPSGNRSESMTLTEALEQVEKAKKLQSALKTALENFE